LSLITPDIQQVIYTAIIAKCQKLGCTVMTVCGIEYHIHLLTGFLRALGVADMIKQVKGSSFHLDTTRLNRVNFSNGKATREHLPLAMMRSTV
jgi:REP element-mobilizing transposase RayT